MNEIGTLSKLQQAVAAILAQGPSPTLEKENTRLGLELEKQRTVECLLQERRKAIRVSLDRIREETRIPELLACVAREETALIIVGGEYWAAIQAANPKGSAAWISAHNLEYVEATVKVSGCSRFTVTKDCGVDEVGMDYEVDYADLEEEVDKATWLDSAQAVELYGESNASGEIEYDGDQHGIWARSTEIVPVFLFKAGEAPPRVFLETTGTAPEGFTDNDVYADE